MTRGLFALMGLGLLALWLAGIISPRATSAMAWLDGACGVIALFGAFELKSRTPRVSRMSGAILLSLALFAVWIGGLFYGSSPWQAWWTLAFGFVGLLAALVSAMSVPEPEVEAEPEVRQDRDRAA